MTLCKNQTGTVKALTPKQRRLVKGIVDGKTQKEAAKDAGLNEQYVSGILKKPEVQATMAELMDLAGLSDAELLRRHLELLAASKTIPSAPGRKAVEVPDWQARGKALELAYKLKGAFRDKVELTGKVGGAFEFVYVLPPGAPGGRGQR